MGLRGLRAGIEAAAAREGELVLSSQAMKRLGGWILRLGGWEITLALLLIEATVWVISPNDLEKWCESNVFGRAASKAPPSASDNLQEAVLKQNDAFDKAIGKVTTRSQS
ncbi:hypothetical protein VN11_18475 [Stenotrophomonas maltophilia]|nr:hypothetical protein VN11_18475 [Stenotrophomonas maltophilia]